MKTRIEDTYSHTEAVGVLGTSRTKIWKMKKAGIVKSVKINGQPRYLKSHIDNLPKPHHGRPVWCIEYARYFPTRRSAERAAGRPIHYALVYGFRCCGCHWEYYDATKHGPVPTTTDTEISAPIPRFHPKNATILDALRQPKIKRKPVDTSGDMPVFPYPPNCTFKKTGTELNCDDFPEIPTQNTKTTEPVNSVSYQKKDAAKSMGRPKGTTKVPSYPNQPHASGQARIRMGGHDVYLGPFGSEESKEKYNRVVSEWLAKGRPIIRDGDTGATIIECIVPYWNHVQTAYPSKGERYIVRIAMRWLRTLYGSTPIRSFGPNQLEAMMFTLADTDKDGAPKGVKLTRNYVMLLIRHVTRFFKWAEKKEFADKGTFHNLATADQLKPGRSPARETEPVTDVETKYIDAVRPFLNPWMLALLELQLETGARPGEFPQIRGCDIDMSDDACWLYRPAQHKGRHLKKDRVIAITRHAQEIIRPWLRPNPMEYLFQPFEMERARHAKRHEGRDAQDIYKREPSRLTRYKPKPLTKKFRPYINETCYWNAVQLACDAADAEAHRRRPDVPADERIVPRWHVHRLRHNRATMVAETQGITAASLILGHSNEQITRRYIHASMEQLKKAAIASEAQGAPTARIG